MPRITFQPRGLVVACDEGESIFSAAQRAGSPLASACGARASCGLCRVRVLAGEEHLSPLTDDEKRHLGNVYFLTKLRLGCQAKVEGGDVVVEIPGIPTRRRR